jgi:uncharacterized protein
VIGSHRVWWLIASRFFGRNDHQVEIESRWTKMGRHFTSTLVCTAAIALFLSISLEAAPPEQPSFDCRKAASSSEKTICANAELSRLDSQLGRIWKTLLDDFSDSAQKPQMKADQKAWIARRGNCGDDANCIGKLYRERLSTLSGTDPQHRFAGMYQVKDIGSFAAYPLGTHYLINIQTAEPQQGNWTCQLTGEAEATGDDLKINVEGAIFRARLRDSETLVVANDDSVSAAAGKFCGLNGTFAFSYLRVPLNPSN